MDSDYSTYLVRDSRLNNIQGQMKLPVYSGASNNTYTVYNSNGDATPSTAKWNIQCPSPDVAIDRRFFVEMTCKFRYTRNASDATAENPASIVQGAGIFSYGGTDSFQSFPINRMTQSASLRLNNSVYTNNISENLPGILRMFSEEELMMYQDGTPVFLDNYRYLSDAGVETESYNSPFSSYKRKSYNQFLYPRGCHPAVVNSVLHTGTGGANNANLVVSNEGGNTNGTTELWTIEFTSTFFEPLFLSPLLFGNPNKVNDGAFLGIKTIDLQLQFGEVQRAFSTSLASLNTAPNNNYSFQLIEVSGAKLHLNFLSLPASLKIPPKFIVDYTDYTRYRTVLKSGNLGTSPKLETNSIQLQSVPEMILIYVKKSENNLTIKDSDTFLQITNVSIKFANRSGLLSSASQYQLYKMCRDNGVKLDWLNWSGTANQAVTPDPGNVDSGKGSSLKLVGSVLAINPSKDLSIPEEFSNGSGGTFDLQASITVVNDVGNDIDLDLIMLVCERGYMKTEFGNTSTNISPLTPDQVIATNSQVAIDSEGSDQSQLLGGARAEELNKMMKMNAHVNRSLRGGARSGGLGRYCYK